MPGNSQRRNRRNPGSKKGPVVGSGGQRRKGLEGKGPTPPKHLRPGHPATRRKPTSQFSKPKVAPGRRSSGTKDAPELLVGRNPIVEALRANIPALALYVAIGIETDARITEAVKLASARGLSILDVSRNELDRMTGGVLHQGVALKVPPYHYAEFETIVQIAQRNAPGLIVALDGITDPRNLGAIVRSAAAFGAHGVLVPQRRAATMTATAWRTSAGAAARLPVAQVTNLVRTLKDTQTHGFTVVGLAADADMPLDNFSDAAEPLLIVIGSEGKGLSRLTAESCDVLLSIPMAGQAESLNASVAAAVTLAEIARQRRPR